MNIIWLWYPTCHWNENNKALSGNILYTSEALSDNFRGTVHGAIIEGIKVSINSYNKKYLSYSFSGCV